MEERSDLTRIFDWAEEILRNEVSLFNLLGKHLPSEPEPDAEMWYDGVDIFCRTVAVAADLWMWFEQHGVPAAVHQVCHGDAASWFAVAAV